MAVGNKFRQKWLLRGSVKRLLGLMWCLLVLFSVSGCRQQTANQLLGRWEGHPDTAAARSEREQKQYGGQNAGGTSRETAPATDWERYDAIVYFDFQSAERLEMSLDGDEKIRSGRWQIVTSTPAACTIEVRTDSSGELDVDGALAESTLRRFELELDERGGECIGFLLSEVGADRQLGALYFRRVD